MERLARYELIAKIATGGMAEIWVATATAECRTAGVTVGGIYVVKKLFAHHKANDEFIQMFKEEARIAGALRHPNIVRTFEASSEAGIHYIVMEYLHGEDLRTISRKLRAESKRLPVEHALNIVAGAAAGLEYAHAATGEGGAPLEIIHRDVSPHNIFVGFDGVAKVVDFGIAKSRERNWETKHGTLKGKVPYMSPEQIKTRRLDRRTDIYSLGVVLYELVVGQKPYVLSAGGDFALMMAIARHDVRLPTDVDPRIDRELEGIILRAMAYDPRQRFPRLADLRDAIVAYADAKRLDISSPNLARFIGQTFGERVDAWRTAALASSALAAHVVEIEEQRARAGADDGDGELTSVDEPDGAITGAQATALLAAPKSAASLLASSSAAIAAVVDVMGVTVVSLQGTIDESFEGAALGGSLSGDVLFDLKGVERVTSFGVREWLEMMRVIAEDGDARAWLARCPEAIVTQMALIRSFPDAAKIISFEAQFLCDDCGLGFAKLLDCEHDADWFRGQPSHVGCPRCNGSCKLDDDLALFAFAAPHAGAAVPERLRQVIATVEQSDRGALSVVDKVVGAEETRLRVLCDIDGSVRWNRIFDGIEGKLVLDFRGGRHVAADGASALARALEGLGRDVTEIELAECPLSLFAALGSRALGPRPRITTLALDGRCDACSAGRSGSALLGEVTAALDAGRAPVVACRRCGGPIDVTHAVPLLRSVLPIRVPRVPEPPPVASSPAVSRDAPPPPERATSRTALFAAAFGVFVAGCILVFVVGLRRHLAAQRSPSESSTSTSRAPELELDSPLVGKSAAGLEIAVRVRAADADTALVQARDRADSAVVMEIEAMLPAAVARALAAAPPGSRSAIGERFRRDVGAFAGLERVAEHVETSPGAVVLTVRYALGASAFERAVAHYGTTKTVGVFTVAPAFPSRREGLIVVDAGARRAAFPPGSLLVSVDGRAVPTIDVLAQISSSRAHDATFIVGGTEAPSKIDLPRTR